MELSQEEGGELVKPLLHLQISEVLANVRGRSWDSSAAISVNDIVIFDHITLGKDLDVNCGTVELLFNGHLDLPYVL